MTNLSGPCFQIYIRCLYKLTSYSFTGKFHSQIDLNTLHDVYVIYYNKVPINIHSFKIIKLKYNEGAEIHLSLVSATMLL